MTITVEFAQERGLGGSVNGYGRRSLIRGFYVCRDGRRVQSFAQGSAQKWTPALEASLRKRAEDWAEKMRAW